MVSTDTVYAATDDAIYKTTADVQQHQFTPLDLPPDTLIIGEHIVPDLLYKDGQIVLKILGTKAVSGLLVLSEYEKGDRLAVSINELGGTDHGLFPQTHYLA